MTKIAGSRSESGSISQRHGSTDPDRLRIKMSWIRNTALKKNYYKAGKLNLPGYCIKMSSLDAKDEAVGEDTVEDLCSVLLPLLLLLLPPVLNSASQPRQPPPPRDAAEGKAFMNIFNLCVLC
jgi:hypothetical protein